MSMFEGPARNPYEYDAPNVGPFERHEPVVTLRDLDRLVNAKLADARREWAEETRRECVEAWERGRERGFRAGERDMATRLKDQADEVCNRRLQHIQFALERERPKSTIAAEREFIAAQADQLCAAIRVLRDIG